MNNTLKVDNISKSFRRISLFASARIPVHALKEVSFQCGGGSTLCVLGPNGAGKTTLMKILAGLIFPDSGKVLFSGKHGSVRSGLVSPNDRSFYWRLTGRQNLDFFASLHGYRGRARNSQVSALLERCGLADEADRPFRLYSAGMKQKLMIARALLGNPQALLLDEPTSHLDPAAKKSIHSLIKSFTDRIIILSTHDLTEAGALSDEIILLNGGSVIARGNVDSLRLSEAKVYTIRFESDPVQGWDNGLLSKPARSAGGEHRFIIHKDESASCILSRALNAGGRIISCGFETESLEDIFTRITEGKS